MALPDKPFQWVANFTQVPNEFFEVAPYLTEPELRIMLYAIRHTIGWDDKRQARSAHISMSNFANGYTLGDTHYEGTHLTEVTIRKALIELVKLGLLEKVGEVTPDGQKWHLPHKCNTSALEKRARDRYEKDRIRTVNGRKKAAEKRLIDQGGYEITPDQGGYGITGEGGYEITPKGVMAQPQINKGKRKEKERTTSAHAIANAVPILSPNEKDVSYPFVEQRLSSSPINGKNESSAPAENRKQGKAKPTTTPSPSPLPQPAAPVADVQEFAGKLDAAKGEKVNPAVALGEAWGITPANGDFGLYMRKAKELLKDIPIEEFKAYCDWRKKQAGDFASKLTIATLTGNGHVSAYLAQRNEAAEKERKQRELEEQIYARYPQLRPRETSEPVEYMPADEVQRMMDMVLNPPTRQENAS